MAFFGANETSAALLCVVGNEERVREWQRSLFSSVNLSLLDLSQIERFRDIEVIQKHYEIPAGSEELNLAGGLEAAVLTRLAVKGV